MKDVTCSHPAFGPDPDIKTLVVGTDGLAVGEHQDGTFVVVCGLCCLEAEVDEQTADRWKAVILMGPDEALAKARTEARAFLNANGERVEYAS